jgi:hypothetical protein
MGKPIVPLAECCGEQALLAGANKCNEKMEIRTRRE